jgi:hypothetical protein
LASARIRLSPFSWVSPWSTSWLEVNGWEKNTAFIRREKYRYVKKNRLGDPSDFQQKPIAP